MATGYSRFVWNALRISQFIKPGRYGYLRCHSTTTHTPSFETKRIPTVSELYREVTNYIQQDEDMSSMAPAPKYLDGLVHRTMADSYMECMIDLQDPHVARKYSNSLGGLRIGRILEDLDVLGAVCCFRHNMPDPKQKRTPFVMVTSMTEKLEVNTISVDTECCFVKLSGHVAWTGRSTMEVPMSVSLVNVEADWKESPIMKAVFVFNARDHKDGSSARVYPLIATNDEEEDKIQQGTKRHQQRKLISSDSYWKSPPSIEEREVIHDLFLQSMDPESLSLTERKLPPNSEWMETTKRTIIVPTPTDISNVYGTVFGGYIMRTSAEIAFTTCAMFSKSPVTILHVSDIQFKAPSRLEAILIFTAEIAYTEGNKMHVRVQTDVTNTKVKFTSNTSHWIVSSPHELPTVLPTTYGEYMLYLDARRRFKDVMEHKPTD